MGLRKREQAAARAAVVSDKRDDARAESMAIRKSRGAKAFSGSCGNFAADGSPLFTMKSNPGFQRTGSVRGTTYRGGKQGTLKIQRENPAKGEEPMDHPTWGTWEVIERETGEVVTGVEPPGMPLPRGAWHPSQVASVTTERGERVPVLSRRPYLTVVSKKG